VILNWLWLATTAEERLSSAGGGRKLAAIGER